MSWPKQFDGVTWNIQVGSGAPVMRTLSRVTRRLKDIAHLFVGLQTDADDVFILNEVGRKNTQLIANLSQRANSTPSKLTT